MANNYNEDASRNDSRDESSPLLNNQSNNDKKSSVDGKASAPVAPPPPPPQKQAPAPLWTANGMPLPHGSVMGEPMGRAQWDSSLCACLGRNDEFCSSDLEVCELLFFLSLY